MLARELTAAEKAALDEAARRPIDTSGEDAEIRDFSHAIRGPLYRPLKQQLTLKLDADLVDWFKRHAIDGREVAQKGYQTRINRALRLYVQQRDPMFDRPMSPAPRNHAKVGGR